MKNHSNLENFIGRKEFYWSGIKDVILIDNNLYVSYINSVHECYNISILKAGINDFVFKEFFTPAECIDQKNNLNFDGSPIKGEFAGIQSGGKMIKFEKNKLILSVGDFRIRGLAQKKDSIFGKIISLDLNNKNVSTISMGHRNSQGMILQENEQKEKFIISTEHGPKGGDEINIIKTKLDDEIQNFGWPISSYGEHYDSKFREDSPLYKSHSEHGFIEPIYYFKKGGLGINQIIEETGILNSHEIKNYIVTSLSGKTIFIFEHDQANNKFEMVDEIYFGSRIRDIEIIDNVIVITDESDSPSVNFIYVSSN